MIRLMNVTKYFMTDFGRHYVFRNVTLDLPLDKNVGIIGPNGAGKSTFLRLIGGADTPSSGRILKSGRISPPMGLTPGLQGSLTAAENARFAGRIYGMQRSEIDAMINYVREIADIGPYFDMPVATYSAGMRQRVAFAVNMSMKFDYYLFDEISAGGDRAFRKTAKAMIAERLRTSRFILSSHDIDEILEICHSGIVIKDGQLTFFDDVRDAATFYGEDSATSSGNGKSDEKKKAKRAKKRQKKRRARRAKKETAPKSREASPRPSKEAKDEAVSTKRTKSLTSTALARKRLKLDESTASAGPRPQNSNRSLRHNRA
jgi:capsular polysaccharide transport system ATP-binding protein